MLATTISTALIVALLRQTNLTVHDQRQIERAITAVAQERNWTQHTAAQWFTKQAFPEHF